MAALTARKIEVLKAVEALKAVEIPSMDFVGGELIDTTVNPTVIENEDGVFISAEDGKGVADYYGEFRGGYPYIAPALEAAAKRLGLALEWNDPGTLGVYPD